MKALLHKWLALACLLTGFAPSLAAVVVFEATSPYHLIRVTDDRGIRTLHFDNSTESRMSLRNPLDGHFEYIEFYHMPWLWNERITNALMIGLGGGSAARLYLHYHTNVQFEVVELDPKVVRVAEEFFGVRAGPRLRITNGDGRNHLRRTNRRYDVMLLDAYTANRYGSAIPYGLATKEFFEIARSRLTENGVLAYNVIGSHRRSDGQGVVAAIYRTLRTVFPQVYLFPAATSENVVLVATRSPQLFTLPEMQARASELIQRKVITEPFFRTRLQSVRTTPPAGLHRAKILEDNFAPVDGMLNVGP